MNFNVHNFVNQVTLFFIIAPGKSSQPSGTVINNKTVSKGRENSPINNKTVSKGKGNSSIDNKTVSKGREKSPSNNKTVSKVVSTVCELSGMI